ncbi:MAG: peptide-methionine (S)-S-oxide reductase MsrA [Candidatus Riflebacteria bacterium]|nr:peptide-methionine (S)-S-oxide reductase MsrA [Candidatus Riflebacteria bacterium]
MTFDVGLAVHRGEAVPGGPGGLGRGGRWPPGRPGRPAHCRRGDHSHDVEGAGCFWCVEAVFAELDGVLSVESGYSGGRTADPTYEDVCTGRTGHAEVCQIRYDPARLRFEDLLEVFWKTHDPTTPDRQGSDVGSQYRSVVFFHSDRQRQLAEEYRKKLDASGAFSAPVVTAVEPFRGFYRAEDYHQDYFRLNGERPYCRLVIGPKVEKFREVFRGKLKSP